VANVHLLKLSLLALAAFVLIGRQTPLKPSGDRSSVEQQIPLAVTVTDNKGSLVSGLEAVNFAVEIDNQPASVLTISDKNEPVSVGILFDSSGSMWQAFYERSLRSLKDAVSHFIRVSNQSNEYFVIGFNKQPQLLADWTKDSKTILNAIGAGQPKGLTAFNDACYLGIDKLQRARHAKRALIVISDGADSNSHYAFKDLLELLKGSDVLVYSFNIFSERGAGSSPGIEDQGNLNQLSEVSGGLAFSKIPGRRLNPSDTLSPFQAIAQELRSQYKLLVYPGSISDGRKWRKIRVTIMPRPGDASRETKHLAARTRQGIYY
jgi:Ca-activated chloride channel family protein